MGWRLHVFFGPVPEPERDDNGVIIAGAELPEDTREEVTNVDYDERPDNLDWVPPQDPAWGAMREDGKRSRGGTYSYTWEKL